jgi:hypothetical protein
MRSYIRLKPRQFAVISTALLLGGLLLSSCVTTKHPATQTEVEQEEEENGFDEFDPIRPWQMIQQHRRSTQ